MQGNRFLYRGMGPTQSVGSPALEELAFDLFLLEEGEVPRVALEAPLGSWILARLSAESTPDASLVFETPQSRSPGSGQVELAVFDERAEVGRALLIFQPHTVDLKIFSPQVAPEAIRDDLAELVLSRPTTLSTCLLEILVTGGSGSPEDDATAQVEVYGWDGDELLGRDNPWNAAEAGVSWPGEDFPRYYENALRQEAKTLEMAALVIPKAPPPSDEDDLTAEVVSTTCAGFRQALDDADSDEVLLRLYDLDGDLEEADTLGPDRAVERLARRVEEGYDAAWQTHEGHLVLKIWEYPADEPPWDSVLESLDESAGE